MKTYNLLNRIFIISTFVIVAAKLETHAVINLGTWGTIGVSASTALSYDSNIQGREGSDSDNIWLGDLAFRWSRPSPRFEFGAVFGLRAQRYADFDQFDHEGVYFNFDLGQGTQIRTDRFVITGNLSFDNDTKTDFDIGEIVTVRRYGARASIVYDPNQHYTIVINTGFGSTDPDSPLQKSHRYNFGGELQIPWSQRIQLLGGMDFATVHFDDPNTPNRDTAAYFVGMSGLVSPKIQASLRTGAQTQTISGESGSSTVPYIAGNLDWTLNELTQISLSCRNSISSTIDGRQSENFTTDLGIRRSISQRLNANAAFGYGKTKYSDLPTVLSLGRKDDFFRASLMANYTINRWASASFSVVYQDRSSNSQEFGYSRTQMTIRFSATW